MRRSTRAVRKHDGDADADEAPDGNKRARSPAKVAEAVAATTNSNKKSKRTAIATRASPSSSSLSSGDEEDFDAGTVVADAPVSGAGPMWVHSLFSQEQRAQWNDFLRTKCLARVSDDFYDLFELAHSISKDHPLGKTTYHGGAWLMQYVWRTHGLIYMQMRLLTRWASGCADSLICLILKLRLAMATRKRT